MTTGTQWPVPGSGAAKEVRFLAFAQMATGSAVPTTAASEMKRKWCVKKEEVVGPCVNVNVLSMFSVRNSKFFLIDTTTP